MSGTHKTRVKIKNHFLERCKGCGVSREKSSLSTWEGAIADFGTEVGMTKRRRAGNFMLVIYIYLFKCNHSFLISYHHLKII